MSKEYLPGNSALAHDIVGQGDWKYWYAMRFVDRDIMIRYHGEGIGHHTSSMEARTDNQSDSLSDTEEHPNREDISFDEDSDSNNHDNEAIEEVQTTELVEDQSSDEDEEPLNEEDDESEVYESEGYESEGYESEEDMEPLQYEY